MARCGRHRRRRVDDKNGAAILRERTQRIVQDTLGRDVGLPRESAPHALGALHRGRNRKDEQNARYDPIWDAIAG